ncbi:MAG: hypothetical protein RIT02_3049, partial [Planctomycetota bacterium]
SRAARSTPVCPPEITRHCPTCRSKSCCNTRPCQHGRHLNPPAEHTFLTPSQKRQPQLPPRASYPPHPIKHRGFQPVNLPVSAPNRRLYLESFLNKPPTHCITAKRSVYRRNPGQQRPNAGITERTLHRHTLSVRCSFNRESLAKTPNRLPASMSLSKLNTGGYRNVRVRSSVGRATDF